MVISLLRLSIKDARKEKEITMCILNHCDKPTYGRFQLCIDCQVLWNKHLPNKWTWAATIIKDSKRRAKEKGYPHELTTKDIYALIPADWSCPILKQPFQLPINGKPNKYSATLDKLDPALGYTKGNVRLISKLANEMKSSATIEELKLFAKWVASSY